MEHSQNFFTSEAATDEPASSPNPSSVGHSRIARARPPDEPDDLVSDRLGHYVPVATDALNRRRRCDGFTPDRQVVFLEALSRCGVVADACRAAGISRDTAYNFRNRAEGAAFALAWDAAFLKSRERVADELHSRALNGVVDKIYRNGELWGERHRHDNRLAMALLTRLDRRADGLGEGAATARTVAREWDQFLDIVRDGGDGAGDFLASRAARERELAAEPLGTLDGEAREPAVQDLYTSLEGFERLFAYSMFGGGLEGEADLTGLEPDAMADWSDNDWLRAERGGLLESLTEEEWPEAVRETAPDSTHGECRDRQDIPPAPGLERARRHYRRHFPDAAARAGFVAQSPRSTIISPHPSSEGGSG